jgi:glyoxylase-like metal-dependent hydrolase (beta-lactamase superfamily II)
MIDIKIFVFNPFQENTFVLSDETGECIVVDAGCYDETERNDIDSYIASKNLKCVKLVCTHCHVDHVLGNAYIAQKYNPEIIGHKNDIFLLEDAVEHGKVFGFDVETPPPLHKTIEEGEYLTFGHSKLQILHVPGHSPGSIALYSPEDKFVIVGDVLFKESVGRTDLPGGNYDQLMQSIYKKLMILPDDTVVFPGHGPSTTIHEEALDNPFLT